MERANFARPRAVRACAGKLPSDATGRKLHFPASSWRQNYVARKAERDSLRFLTRLPPAGKPVKCGAAGFVRSCVLRFRAPVGVFLRPCEEVRKAPCRPKPVFAVGRWGRCRLGREEGEGAAASLQPAPGPGDPAAEPRPEELRREARGPRTRARAFEGLSSRLAPKACLPAWLFRSSPARCLSEPFSVKGRPRPLAGV